jgi:hypothetical protein
MLSREVQYNYSLAEQRAKQYDSIFVARDLVMDIIMKMSLFSCHGYLMNSAKKYVEDLYLAWCNLIRGTCECNF